MKQFYIIRHTTPDIDQGICYGISNLDVNKDFEIEASVICETLLNIKTDFVFSSPLQRCNKLAHFLFPEMNIKYSNQLKELDFGNWEMTKWADIDPQEMHVWSEDILNQAPHQGESFGQFYNRIIEYFTQLENNTPDETVTAIVSHSGVIRCLLMKFLEIPYHKIFSWQLDYGAVIKITVYNSDYAQVKILKG